MMIGVSMDVFSWRFMAFHGIFQIWTHLITSQKIGCRKNLRTFCGVPGFNVVPGVRTNTPLVANSLSPRKNDKYAQQSLGTVGQINGMKFMR
jgi:hypothetical protein